MERKETPRNFCEEVYGKSTNVDIGKWKSINTYYYGTRNVYMYSQFFQWTWTF